MLTRVKQESIPMHRLLPVNSLCICYSHFIMQERISLYSPSICTVDFINKSHYNLLLENVISIVVDWLNDRLIFGQLFVQEFEFEHENEDPLLSIIQFP